MIDKIGVVHGRFQVLHNDHMKYILEAKKRCEHLIIGICNYEVDASAFTASNPHRSQKSSNPLTYYERMICIKNSMLEKGIARSEFEIVPFPINFPKKIHIYVPLEAKFYLTIYDKWGEDKYRILKDELGLNVDVLWKTSIDKKGISGSNVRQNIKEGKDWSQLVPNSVYQYISEKKLDRKIADYLNSGK